MIFKILSVGIKCSHNFCVSVLHEENILSGNTNTVSSSFMTSISKHYLFCIIKPDTFFLNNLRYLSQQLPSRRLIFRIFGTLSVTVFSISTELISSVLLLFDFMKRTVYWCTWSFRRWRGISLLEVPTAIHKSVQYLLKKLSQIKCQRCEISIF